MNATRGLVLSSAATMLVMANLLLAAGALLGPVHWPHVPAIVLAFNVVYVVPALLAVACAAWLAARDPDFLVAPPAFAAAAIVLLTFVGYFLLALAWFPLMKRLGMVPPQMETGAPVTLFMTLAGMACVAVPVWWIEARIVRRLRAKADPAAAGARA